MCENNHYFLFNTYLHFIELEKKSHYQKSKLKCQKIKSTNKLDSLTSGFRNNQPDNMSMV